MTDAPMSDPTALVAEMREVAQGWRDAAEDEALAHGEGTEDQGGMEYQAALSDRAAALIAQQDATIEAAQREAAEERCKHVLTLQALTAAEAERDRLREDAERWQALMASQRMHMMGSAGFDYVFDPPDSRKHVDLVDIVPRSGDHLHFGIEFWSTHAAFGDPKWPDDFPRKLLLTYVDELRARAALSTAKERGE